MIAATAAEISAIIAGDPDMMLALHGFLGAIIGEADLGTLIEELPQAVAACSPFADEADMIAVVKSEMLVCLHKLALLRMPAMGTA